MPLDITKRFAETFDIRVKTYKADWRGPVSYVVYHGLPAVILFNIGEPRMFFIDPITSRTIVVTDVDEYSSLDDMVAIAACKFFGGTVPGLVGELEE